MMVARTVGIDDIATYVPRLYLDATDFAKERGIPPEKITKGIGIEKMSIPDAHEDAATMAAMAALKLMQKNDLQPKDIGFIHVATETGLDEAKPISCYVQGMLEQIYGNGSFEHIGAPETKFACVGATYAMIDRLAFINSGWNKGKHAIVIATDIAKYDLLSSGESTQGAAAVALLLKEDPRLMMYEPDSRGFGTRDDQDFFRPVGRTTAVVNGHYSVGCYLRDMRIAADAFRKNMLSSGIVSLSAGEGMIDHVDRIAFHSPFPKMVEMAFASFLIHDWRGLPRWKRIIEQTGPEPDRTGMSDIDFYVSEPYKQFRKKFTKTPEFTAEFEKKVKDSLEALKLIGNSYTASLWMCVESSFEVKTNDLAGKRFAVGSYGSGSSAIVCSFIVQPDYRQVVDSFSLMQDLSRRNKISVAEYEDLHEERLDPHQGIDAPRNEFVLDRLGETETDFGYRYYTFVK